MKLSEQTVHVIKGAEHAISTVGIPGLVVFGWLVDRLPVVAAGVSILWMVYQWYWSEPMRTRRRIRRRRKAKGKSK